MKYLSMWKVTENRIPADPRGRLAQFEAQVGAIESLLKSGLIEEFAFFEADSGYVVIEAESRAQALKVAALFYPFVTTETFEVTPWEKGRDAVREAYSTQARNSQQSP